MSALLRPTDHEISSPRLCMILPRLRRLHTSGSLVRGADAGHTAAPARGLILSDLEIILGCYCLADVVAFLIIPTPLGPPLFSVQSFPHTYNRFAIPPSPSGLFAMLASRPACIVICPIPRCSRVCAKYSSLGPGLIATPDFVVHTVPTWYRTAGTRGQ